MFRDSSGNFQTLFNSFENLISAMLQSPYNVRATKVTGAASKAEVWVNVRWGWYVVPLVLVLASTAFFVTTVMQSSRKSNLFKTSLVSMLVLGHNGIAGGNVAAPQNGK